MCKALVERGCDVSVQNSMGKTAADVAKKCKFNEISDYLFYELRKLKGDVKGNSANE